MRSTLPHQQTISRVSWSIDNKTTSAGLRKSDTSKSKRAQSALRVVEKLRALYAAKRMGQRNVKQKVQFESELIETVKQLHQQVGSRPGSRQTPQGVAAKVLARSDYLRRNGVVIHNLEELYKEYHSLNTHSMNKTHSKKFMLQVMQGTTQCRECNTWCAYDSNLRQHQEHKHKVALGMTKMYYQICWASKGLKSKMHYVCLLCENSPVIHTNRDWPRLALHYINEHSHQLTHIGLEPNWLMRDCLLGVSETFLLEPAFLKLSKGQKPPPHRAFTKLAGQLVDLNSEQIKFETMPLETKQMMKKQNKAPIDLVGLNMMKAMRLLEQVPSQSLPTLDYDAKLSNEQPPDHRQQLVKSKLLRDTEGEFTVKCFESVGRFSDQRGYDHQQAVEQRYRLVKILLKTNDYRTAFLANPARVKRNADLLHLEYDHMGKPLSALKHLTRGEGLIIGDRNGCLALWLRQFCCALQGLQFLHEKGLTCGSFTEDCIHYHLYEPSAKLIPYNLGKVGKHRGRQYTEYAKDMTNWSYSDDLHDVTLTYCRLRMIDLKVVRESQAAASVPAQADGGLPEMIVQLKANKKMLMAGEGLLLQAFRNYEQLSISKVLKTLTKWESCLACDQKWNKWFAVTNDRTEPKMDMDLFTQEPDWNRPPMWSASMKWDKKYHLDYYQREIENKVSQ